jgi:hypothetical protein
MNPCPTLSDIIQHAWWMKKQGYRESTIESAISSLKSISNKTNLLDPESVKAYLANANLKESRKETLVIRLARFYKWKNIEWQPPHYKRIETLPFIPLESEVDQLISGMRCATKATYLQFLKQPLSSSCHLRVGGSLLTI